MNIDVNQELQVYNGYSKILSQEGNSMICISALHLTRQFQDFISPQLDLGWIMRCILDINSYNKFTDPRGEREPIDISIHPEYKYANILLEIASLLYRREKGETINESEYKHYTLSEYARIFYGNELTHIFRFLVEDMKGDF